MSNQSKKIARRKKLRKARNMYRNNGGYHELRKSDRTESVGVRTNLSLMQSIANGLKRFVKGSRQAS